MANRLHKLM